MILLARALSLSGRRRAHAASSTLVRNTEMLGRKRRDERES